MNIISSEPKIKMVAGRCRNGDMAEVLSIAGDGIVHTIPFVDKLNCYLPDYFTVVLFRTTKDLSHGISLMQRLVHTLLEDVYVDGIELSQWEKEGHK